LLVEKAGRYNTVVTIEDIKQMVGHDWNAMSPDERQIVLDIIQDLKMSNKSTLLESLSYYNYKFRPVSIQEFLDSPAYAGSIGKTLYPEVKREIIEIFSSRYQEAIIGGSLGRGKTTQGAVMMIRMIYEVSCIRDPHLAYGITPGDKISFPVIAALEDVAQEVVQKILMFIDQIPYFKSKFWPVKKPSETNGILFPGNIWIPPGASTEARTLGSNAFGALIDEGNFFRKKSNGGVAGNTTDYAESIYLSIKRRMESRFMSKGRLPGMIILLSSKKNLHSFVERRIKESAGDPTVFISEKSMYEMHDPDRYSDKKFRVAIGREGVLSRILEDSEEEPDDSLVIEVPEDFRDAFEKDIDKAIMDIAGYAAASSTPFIAKKQKIIDAIDPNRSHQFSEYVWKQDWVANFKWDGFVERKKDGSWAPIRHPSAPRHVHIDLSKSGDATGLVVSHIAGYKNVQRPGREEEIAPIIEVDFMLRIEAATGGEIVYSEVRRIIYELTQHGFFIKLISSDSYQSASILQTFAEKGYSVKVVSVDRPGPYDVLKIALYEDRIKYYRYEPLLRELRELQKNWKTGKVDHPDQTENKQASKDVADALAGTVFTLTQVAASNYGQVPIYTSAEMAISGEDDRWVLDDPKTMVVGKPAGSDNPEHYEQIRRLEPSFNESPIDWKNNFRMPFDLG
jgi:hypothetical protein